MISWVHLSVCLLFIHGTFSCRVVELSSEFYGSVFFTQIPLDSPEIAVLPATGRPSYFAPRENNRNLYLYHRYDKVSGRGQWIINDGISDSDMALAYIDSWAVLPMMAKSIQDEISRSGWRLYDTDRWRLEPSMELQCAPNSVDRTIFFETEHRTSLRINGYYIERYVSDSHPYQGKVYTHVRLDVDKEVPVYLFEYYHEERHVWLIGEQLGVDLAITFTTDDATQPAEITTAWQSVDGYGKWMPEYSSELWSYENVGDTERYPSMFQYVLHMRSLPIEYNQAHYLRNQVRIPRVGLGTGGIPQEKANAVFRNAMRLEYALFDSAREYGTEAILGAVIGGDNARRRVFLQSKVWPTQLGFLETLQAISQSFQAFKTGYLDQYMLHWPECKKDIDWMHCQDILNPLATWRESWRALEKAYAEGYLQSIGVSNFDLQLLNELEEEIGVILPHIVQNWSDFNHLDLSVRQWCHAREVTYQPYASNRNLQSLPNPIKDTVQLIANDRQVTPQFLSNQFFLQTGAVIIPRSMQNEHLLENVKIAEWTFETDELEMLGWTI